MKTSELTGAALDWAVATIEQGEFMDATWWADFGDESCYSSDWAEGGPIVEREKLKLWYDHKLGWTAQTLLETQRGSTPLIAAMRCFVESKLGDEVEIPQFA